MNERTTLSSDDKIFATGVFLQPVRCVINNIEQWRWVAVGFEDDSFLNGEIVEPCDYADDLDGLFITEQQND